MNTSAKVVKVWDPLVRIGHWTLVVAFFTAYFTEEDFLTQHVWAGYIVGAIVIFRIVWGFIGSKHARFSDFIYSPAAVFGYLKGLISRKPQHYLGHNPAGGAMVFALLLGLSAIVYTGVALYAVEENAGPLAGIIASNDKTMPTATIITAANADEDADEDMSKNKQEKSMGNKEAEKFWEELHEFFVNFTLLLVVLHIGGVLLSSYIDKENLIKAMVTGRKEIPKDK
ncbi:MAG: cytochrome b/b6 domain-containing protein [Methylotenera sp.]